jgi:LysM repeat protein
MMTEVLHQKVRPRKSAYTVKKEFHIPLGVIVRPLAVFIFAAVWSGRRFLRSLVWKRKLQSVKFSENRIHVRIKTLAIPRILTESLRTLSAGINSILRPVKQHAFYFLGGTILLFSSAYFLLGPSLSHVWGRDWIFSLPEDSEIDTLLQAYVEPPVSEITEGELKAIDPVRFTALSLTNHIIGRGDTISGISMKYGLNLDTVVSVNRIEDVRRVPIGAELKLPNQNGILYTVRRGDSLSSIGKAYNVSMHALADVNNLESAVIHPGQELFIPGARMRQMDLKRILGELFMFPANGKFTSAFGPRNDPFTGVRRFHNGIDISGPVGTPILAAMAGKVVKIGVHPSYGRYIIMSHASGYQTWYAHLNKTLVSSGTTMAQGEMIGEMGNTGYSTGSHLHFSIFKNGSPVDPMRFLR